MKNKASVFLKQIMSVLSSIARAKSVAVKNKTSALKARLIMFSVLKSKKTLLGSISEKIHGMLGQHDKGISEDDQSKALVLYNNAAILMGNEEVEDDDKYPDLRHTLFDELDDFEELQGSGSIVDLVRNSREEGEEFRLEDEIDHVADLFIMRFHKQMRMQKLESFKRYQDMLERSA